VAIIIKNVILYDQSQNVGGFVELRTGSGVTAVKLRHNLGEQSLLLSVVGGLSNHVFEVTSRDQKFEVANEINLNGEVVVVLAKKDGSKVETVASGAINLTHPASFLGTPLTEGNTNSYFRKSDKQIAKKTSGQFPSDTEGWRDEVATGCVELGKSSDGIVAGVVKPMPKQKPPSPAVTPPSIKGESGGRGGLSAILDETEKQPISRKSALRERAFQTEAAREIDDLLRNVCSVNDAEHGICDKCPYREYFFGENIKQESASVLKTRY